MGLRNQPVVSGDGEVIALETNRPTRFVVVDCLLGPFTADHKFVIRVFVYHLRLGPRCLCCLIWIASRFA